MRNSTKYLVYEGVIVAAIIMLLFFSFPGCKEVKYIERHHYDTLYIGHNSMDTIKIKDSIHIFGKNDTIYQDRWHFEYIYKNLTDTIYKCRVDTVKVPQIEKEVVEVERKLNWWQKIFIYIGLFFTVITAFSIYKKIKSIWK